MDWQRDSERGVGEARQEQALEGTIPYSNDSQNIMDGWLVSSSTDVPTKNATPLGEEKNSAIEAKEGL